MELVFVDLQKQYSFEPIVATLGQFDGVHQGHLTLLNETIKIGKEERLKTAVITFDPHPDFVLGKESSLSYITPFEVKKQIIERLGFDYLFVINFTNLVANTEPKDFVKEYLLPLNVVRTVVGFDFSFGRKGSGKASDISLYSDGLITNTVIDKVALNNEKVASIGVKNSLVKGDVTKANILLGRMYEIQGEVILGNQVGRTINVPTANISYDEHYVHLKNGVYATVIVVDGVTYPSITNIGHNPSFNYTKRRSLETHIIGFDQNIYGKNVVVKFYKRLRDEVKFASVDEFLLQIEKDKKEALKIINHL